MEQLEAALMKQLQTDTAVEKLEEQRKMFMSKLEELETSLSQRHHEVRLQLCRCIKSTCKIVHFTPATVAWYTCTCAHSQALPLHKSLGMRLVYCKTQYSFTNPWRPRIAHTAFVYVNLQ